MSSVQFKHSQTLFYFSRGMVAVFESRLLVVQFTRNAGSSRWTHFSGFSPVERCHVPEQWNLQQHTVANFKSLHPHSYGGTEAKRDSSQDSRLPGRHMNQIYPEEKSDMYSLQLHHVDNKQPMLQPNLFSCHQALWSNTICNNRI